MKSDTSFALPRNRHGHPTIDIVGLDLTGDQELERLEPEYRIGDHLRRMLLHPEFTTYDAEHRLVSGRHYRIAIVQRGSYFSESTTRPRFTEDIDLAYRKFGKQFGYEPLLASAAFRLREVLTDQQLAVMGLPYVAVVHRPIHWTKMTSEYLFLHVVHRFGKSLIGAGMVRPLSEMTAGALAYFDSDAS